MKSNEMEYLPRTDHLCADYLISVCHEYSGIDKSTLMTYIKRIN